MTHFATLRAGYGTVLLLAPDHVVKLCTGRLPDPRARGVVRVLGARHIVQALLTGGAPTAAVLAVGAEVDLTHSLTALGLAALDPPRRRAGFVDAAAAASFTVIGAVRTARSARRTRGLIALSRWSTIRDSTAFFVAAHTLPTRLVTRLRRTAS